MRALRICVVSMGLFVSMVTLPGVAYAETGYKNCGDAGNVVFHTQFRRDVGAHVYAKSSTAPGSPYSLSARVDPSTSGRLPLANWRFATNNPRAHVGVAPGSNGPAPDLMAFECTGQSGPTAPTVKSTTLGDITCPVGRRPVITSDGWGNHWVYYRSNPGAPYKRVQTMVSNYAILALTKLFVDERAIYDVKVKVTTTRDASWAENWMPTAFLRCNRGRDEDPVLE
jgi:hypothetical protein